MPNGTPSNSPAGPTSPAFPVLLFPNPTAGALFVECREPVPPGTTFRVLDISGRLLLEEKAEPGWPRQHIQAGALPAGLYFLQVSGNGKILGTEKFVKQ